MAIPLSTSNGQKIVIHDSPFASGGEGEVHKIISPTWHQNNCVKVYFPQNRTRERERKLNFMVKNPLANLGDSQARIICWPKDLVYDNKGVLAGFVMPLAFGGSSLLYELCTPKHLSKIWSDKYEREKGTGVESRLKLCVNIAAAVNQIHAAGRYVLVDLKPQNLLVTPHGKISVIDLDSIQISDTNRVMFAAQFATPEYVPVEGNRINPSKDLISENWDSFSLAVIFYQLLFGLHPYAASFQGQYKDSTTIADSIKNGLFVFGSKRNYVDIRPSLHNNFDRIPLSLQNLFIRAFDVGHHDPRVRPKASEWGRVTYEEIQKPSKQWRGMDATVGIKTKATKARRAPTPVIGATRHATTIPAAAPKQTTVHPATTVSATKSEPTPAVKGLVGLLIAGLVLFLIVSICGQLGKRSTPGVDSSSYQTSVVNTINLNLRSGPGVRYSVLMILPQGTKVIRLNESQYADHATWVKVRVGAQDGWVNQEHLR